MDAPSSLGSAAVSMGGSAVPASSVGSTRRHDRGAGGARSRGKARGGGGWKDKTIHQQFSSYIVFGVNATICLLLFLACYGLMLLTLWPLLQSQSPPAEAFNSNNNGEASLHIPPALQDVHLPGEDQIISAASSLRKRLQQVRRGRGVTDANLLDQAMAEFDEMQQKRDAEEREKAAKEAEFERQDGGGDGGGKVVLAGGGAGEKKPSGFVVLGMHRSGTSMLAGLLHTSFGYKVGGPLIGAAFDNEKGFFERVDVVLQNDEFMAKQNVWWANNVVNYDPEKALAEKESGVVKFEKGRTGLQFMNNPQNSPWMQKDPRMCITLKTWLPLLDTPPAAVFSYRNPLEVAMSLKKREKNFTLERGLRLWIAYNMKAIQNSKDLCVVHTSNDDLLKNPLKELRRIADQLTSLCEVPAPPGYITQDHVNKFIDPKLQHNRKEREEDEKDKEVLETWNEGTCPVYSYNTDLSNTPNEYRQEHKLYLRAMKVYCDLKSGKALQADYEWPPLA